MVLGMWVDRESYRHCKDNLASGVKAMVLHLPTFTTVDIDDTFMLESGKFVPKATSHNTSRQDATPTLSNQSSAHVHFCFALHAADAPATLLLLQQHVVWKSRHLRFLECHGIKNSAPEADTPEDTNRPDPVHIITASTCCSTDLVAAVEALIVQVLQKLLKVPVECYLTCPGPVPLFSGNLASLTRPPAAATQCLLANGLTVLQGALDSAALELWRSQVERQVTWAHNLLTARSVQLEQNKIFTFREIAARGRHRFDLRLDVGPCWQQEQHRLEVALENAPWLPAVHSVLGEDVVSILSVVYSLPGADAQEWHSDGPPSAHGQDAYALCVFLPLIDLTEMTGCTEFWPGSHVHEHLIGFGPAAPVLESTFKGYVAAGDVILYDYRVFHRGLENACSDGRRDVLQVVYHKPEYREERNYSSESLMDPPADL